MASETYPIKQRRAQRRESMKWVFTWPKVLLGMMQNFCMDLESMVLCACEFYSRYDVKHYVGTWAINQGLLGVPRRFGRTQHPQKILPYEQELPGQRLPFAVCFPHTTKSGLLKLTRFYEHLHECAVNPVSSKLTSEKSVHFASTFNARRVVLYIAGKAEVESGVLLPYLVRFHVHVP